MQTTIAVILAAGKSTRMKSAVPKVLHPLLGRPMIEYSVATAQQVTGTRPVVVIGSAAEAIRAALGNTAQFVLQDPLLGTGHALQQAGPLLRGAAQQLLVITADMPLWTPETLSSLVQAQAAHAGPITMLTLNAADPRGFGRILRGPGGEVQAIVEEAQATPEQKRITELNASGYCLDAEWTWQALERIPLSPKGEYYLTDLVGVAVADGLPVQALTVSDPQETVGINTRVHLAEAEAILRRRINLAWMEAGVTLVDPATTYIEPGVTIGEDTVIWPNTYLHGGTRIGKDCTIGPNAIIRDTQVGDGCKILASVLESAILEDHVDMGPFARLRKGAHLASHVHMGNFGEVKNSYLAPGVKMGHFSYIGDADIGPDVNIGAGTITCNFTMDGKKNPTRIGAGTFIGSDTMLVAPLTIGAGSATGAGSVVTKDVPDGTLVVGVPARPIRKLEKRD